MRISLLHFFFILSVSTLCFDFSTFSLFSISFFPTALPSTLADSLASDGQESESGAALFMLMVLFMCIFFIKYLQLFFLRLKTRSLISLCSFFKMVLLSANTFDEDRLINLQLPACSYKIKQNHDTKSPFP